MGTRGPGDYRNNTCPPPETGHGNVPISTWLISAVTVIVLAAAGVVLLQGRRTPHVASFPGSDSTQPVPKPPDPQPRTRDLPLENQLDITERLLQAQRRASIWNPTAVLTSIGAIVRGGATLEALTIEFGQAIGQPVPDAPVNADYFVLEWSGERFDSTEVRKESLRRALPVPNCPLHVAIRKLTEAGDMKTERLGVLLAKSDRHNRPVWLLTTEDGGAHSIDAGSCSLLRR